MRNQIFTEQETVGKTIEKINYISDIDIKVILFSDNTFIAYECNEIVEDACEWLSDTDIRPYIEDLGIHTDDEIEWMDHPEKATELIESLRQEISDLKQTIANQDQFIQPFITDMVNDSKRYIKQDKNRDYLEKYPELYRYKK